MYKNIKNAKNLEKFLGEDVITNKEELIKKIHKNG